VKLNSRRAAAFAVARWIADHGHVDGYLGEGPDRAFVQDLVYTTVRRFRPLRSTLGKLVSKWPKGELEALLLVGAAQILYMPDVPDFAAVSETVKAAKDCPNPNIARVVNGVLRNLIRRREEFEAALASAPLAERESYPNAIVNRWIARYGEENAEKMCRWHNAPAETHLAYPGRFEPLPRGTKVTEVPGFAEGEFIVQDPATAGAVELLDVHKDTTVLDLCAAPGGKSIQAAWRGGKVTAVEVNPARLRRLRENVVRVKLDIETLSAPPEGKVFDRVLADVPCSNTGVLRRRPDARWRWDGEHLAELTALQGEILERAAAYVAPGGLLVYSTCSNEPEENAAQVEAFLADHPEFSEVARKESVPFESGCDGAFACALKRQ
jgi:16S rRNA (cytosine967-C5)-methyltransferase